MYYLKLEGSHYQMGVKRGKEFRANGITFPLHLDEFQLEHGRKSEQILKDFFPEVCEEIQGVSDTIGVSYSPFASWLLCMGCCMYNLKENIPVEIRGCTAFAYHMGEEIIYGRNNDLPPYLKDGSKSEIYAPLNGNRFHITTSSFINGEEGMNEHGLAVAMTFVMTNPQKIRPGFNSCFIVRYLLEKADCTKKAISLLMKLPVASNCNILIADKKGELFVVECTPNEKRIREALNLDKGKIVCAVNSFTSDKKKRHDAAGKEDYRSVERYRTVVESFRTKIDGNLIEKTQQLLRGDYGFLCQYDDIPDFETVWSSVFDLRNRMIYQTEGDPRTKKFIEDSRLHDIVRSK